MRDRNGQGWASRTRQAFGGLLALAVVGPAVGQTRLLDGDHTIPHSYAGGMAYDAARGVVVMYPHNDSRVFEWNGSDWRRIQGTRNGYSLSGMAYDAGRQRCVQFAYDGTFEWDGTRWELRAPVNAGPSNRTGAALAYDPVHDVTVLYGGRDRTQLADTWHWDGKTATWTLIDAQSAAGPRARHAMFYDATRGTIVAFGGLGPLWLDDTWEYDVATQRWTEIRSTVSPSAREFAAACYDASRQRGVLYGGAHLGDPIADCWEFISATGAWVKVADAAPGPRVGSSLAFDPVRREVLMYGGVFPPEPNISETWAFDAAGWKRVADHGSPPMGGALTYDWRRGVLIDVAVRAGDREVEVWERRDARWERRRTRSGPAVGTSNYDIAAEFDPHTGNVIVLVTTWDSATGFDMQTWELGGADGRWTLLNPAVQPAARRWAELAYDVASDRILLFGGVLTDPPFGRVNDTWEWDRANATWRQLTPATSPNPLSGAAMTTDLERGRIVLVGDHSRAFELWEWDGETWEQAQPAMQPPTDLAPRIAYDIERRRTVYTRNIGHYGHPDVWEWDGSEWLPQVVSLPVERNWDFAYHPGLREMIMLNRGGGSLAYTSNTLLYNAIDRGEFETFGQGCAGSAGVPRVWAEPFDKPWIGAEFELNVTGLPSRGTAWMLLGFSNTDWGGRSLPYPLDGLGLTGCSALVSVDAAVPLPTATGGGVTSWTGVIPNDRALVLREIYAQAFVLDPAASNRGKATVSNGGVLRFGSR